MHFIDANKVDFFHYAYLLCLQALNIEVLYFQGESKKDTHCFFGNKSSSNRANLDALQELYQ